MKQIFSIFFLISISQPCWAITKQQYEAKGAVFVAPIDQRDLTARVRPKNSLNEVLGVVRQLKRDIKKAAKIYGIDPVHVAAAIAGEHAMNVDVKDTLQQYAVEKEQFLDLWIARHNAMEDDLFTMIQEPEFKTCNSKGNDYYYWYCIARTWYKDPKYKTGKWAVTKKGMYRAFTDKFFNPNGVGTTFGVGQMSPLRALMVTDLVSSRTNIPRLNFRRNGDIKTPFEHVLSPNKVVYYVAATVFWGMIVYERIAKFDLSENPGLTATLYNLGQENIKASERKRKTIKAIRRNGVLEYPETNKLGKWVNQHIDDIEAALR